MKHFRTWKFIGDKIYGLELCLKGWRYPELHVWLRDRAFWVGVDWDKR